MAKECTVAAIERQGWLNPVENGLQKGVNAVFSATGEGGRKVKNFLHGTWLGHPLHPVLTDIPVGAWTAAMVLDIMEEATGDSQYGKGADAAVTVGLVGAGAAAVAGLTDWSATDFGARRVGVVHGLLNIAAAGLYTTSLTCRKKGDRATGRALAAAGFLVAGFSAWLGGHLVYEKQIGVDHTGAEPAPQDWVDVGAEADVAEGQGRRVEAGGVRVLLTRCNGKICAIGEVCSHLGGPLAEGKIENGTVTCPWHASRFDLATGEVIDGPATHPQPLFEARVEDGRVQVRAASTAQ